MFETLGEGSGELRVVNATHASNIARPGDQEVECVASWEWPPSTFAQEYLNPTENVEGRCGEGFLGRVNSGINSGTCPVRRGRVSQVGTSTRGGGPQWEGGFGRNVCVWEGADRVRHKQQMCC